MPIYQNIEGTETFRCAGFLVNDDTVLTAAECITHISDDKYVYVAPSKITVIVGITDTNKAWGESLKTSKKRSLSVTKFYRSGNLAALKLKERVIYNNRVQPICIPNDSSSYNSVDSANILSWQYFGEFYAMEFKNQGKVCENSGVCKIDEHLTEPISPFCHKHAGVPNCVSSGGGVVALKNGKWQLLYFIYTGEDPFRNVIQTAKYENLLIHSSIMRDEGWFSY